MLISQFCTLLIFSLPTCLVFYLKSQILFSKSDIFLCNCNCCFCCLVAKLCLSLLWPYGLPPARLICPWNILCKNTGGGWHFLLQGIFSTQGRTCISCIGRQILYHWATREAPATIIHYYNNQSLNRLKTFRYSYLCVVR